MMAFPPKWHHLCVCVYGRTWSHIITMAIGLVDSPGNVAQQFSADCQVIGTLVVMLATHCLLEVENFSRGCQIV